MGLGNDDLAKISGFYSQIDIQGPVEVSEEGGIKGKVAIFDGREYINLTIKGNKFQGLEGEALIDKVKGIAAHVLFYQEVAQNAQTPIMDGGFIKKPGLYNDPSSPDPVIKHLDNGTPTEVKCKAIYDHIMQKVEGGDGAQVDIQRRDATPGVNLKIEKNRKGRLQVKQLQERNRIIIEEEQEEIEKNRKRIILGEDEDPFNKRRIFIGEEEENHSSDIKIEESR